VRARKKYNIRQKRIMLIKLTLEIRKKPTLRIRAWWGRKFKEIDFGVSRMYLENINLSLDEEGEEGNCWIWLPAN